MNTGRIRSGPPSANFSDRLLGPLGLSILLLYLQLPAAALTIVQDLTNDTTFAVTGSPYYICRTSNRDPIVYTGVTVTVESGVQILKGSGQVSQNGDTYNIAENWQIGGTLIATGADFDNVGNSNGALWFLTGSTGRFDNCHFHHAGGGAACYGMIMASSTGAVDLVFTNCLFDDTPEENGIYANLGGGRLAIYDCTFSNVGMAVHVKRDSGTGLIVKVIGSTLQTCAWQSGWAVLGIRNGQVTLSNNTFHGNGRVDVDMYDVYEDVGPLQAILVNNTFIAGNATNPPLKLAAQSRINAGITNAANSFSGFSTNCLLAWVQGNIPADRDAWWGPLGVEYYLPGGVTILGTDTGWGSLTLPAGTVVNFASNGITVCGRLQASGTESSPVVFQGHPALTSPQGGIQAYQQYGGTYGGIFLEHCRFLNTRRGVLAEAVSASSPTAVMVRISNCVFSNQASEVLCFGSYLGLIGTNHVVVEHCTIRGQPDGTIAAITFSGGSSATVGGIVSNTVVADNLRPAVRCNYAAPHFFNCTFAANADGEGMDLDGATLHNCIIWDTHIDPDCLDSLSAFYSCLNLPTNMLSYLKTNLACITTDPLFEGADIASSNLYVDQAAAPGGDGLSETSALQRLDDALDLYRGAYSYRLLTNSPCLGTGESGADMGAALGTADVQRVTAVTVHLAAGNYGLTRRLWHRISLRGAGYRSVIVTGTVYGLQSSARLEDLTVGDHGGRGLFIAPWEAPAILRCRIAGNQAGYRHGAGAYVCRYASPLFRNCLICSNWVGSTSYRGGGVYFDYDSTGLFQNVTITRNWAGSGDGLYARYNATLYLDNTICWSNSDSDFSGSGFSLYATNCCSPSWAYLTAGTGNITNDPRFKLIAGNEFSLRPDSPCRNTGTNRAWMAAATDLDGRSRILEDSVDQGAFEDSYDYSWVAAEPDSIRLDAYKCGTNTAQADFGVYNAGTGSMDYSISPGASWLSVSPTNGTSSGATNQHTLVLDLPSMDVGNYTGTVTVVAPDSSNQQVTVTVWGRVDDPNTALDTPSSLVWQADGDARWYSQSAVTHDGVSAMRSGEIGDGQSSTLRTTIEGPFYLHFWWHASSEEGDDQLFFRVDGSSLATTSGTAGGWSEIEHVESADGVHTLEWVYAKDAWLSQGDDAGYLDEVTWYPLHQESDGDGVPDWQEFKAGTSPDDPLDFFHLVSISNTSPQIVLRWTSASGRTYTIQVATSSLSQAIFEPVASNLDASPPENVYTAVPPDAATVIYRIRLE